MIVSEEVIDPWAVAEYADEELYSNVDHTFDEAALQRIASTERVLFSHSAWDYYAKIWRSDDLYHEVVMVYGNPVAQYTCADVALLVQHVIDVHGRS